MFNLINSPLDSGSDQFDPSSLEITSVDTGNLATNVIPESSVAIVNIRYNTLHTPDSLLNWLKKEVTKIEKLSGITFSLTSNVSALPFLSDTSKFSSIIAKTIKEELNIETSLSTSGGTSDARFLHELCPVVEFGLVGSSMHQTDENVEIKQINELTNVYYKILQNYFQTDMG